MSLLSLTDITKKTPEEILDDNIQNMLDWEFLNANAYLNISIPTSGAYGGSRHKLSLVKDNNYTDGQVWQTYTKNLVWESGVGATNISGVYVNDVFSSLNNGYYIDYPNGRVIFDNPIATNSTVKMEYSHKLISVERVNVIPFFKRLQEDNYRVDNNLFHEGSGTFLPHANNRANLPVVAFESFSRSTSPYALGGYQRKLNVDVKLHIIGQNEAYCKRLGNILTDNQKVFYLYNSNEVEASGAYPLNYLGNINRHDARYTDLIKLNQDGGYRWAKCEIEKTSGEPVVTINENVFMRTITWNTSIVVPGV